MPKAIFSASERSAYDDLIEARRHDNVAILLSARGVAVALDKRIHADRPLLLPANPDLRAHPTCLARHRPHPFKRQGS